MLAIPHRDQANQLLDSIQNKISEQNIEVTEPIHFRRFRN